MSEGKGPTKKTKTNFNNTTKLSTHFISSPCDNFIGKVTANSKYTINTNRQTNVSINHSNNRSGAKCNMMSKVSTPKANVIRRKKTGFENKSTLLISPPSSTKHADPKMHFFNFPGTTKAKGFNKNYSVIGTEYDSQNNANFKNMSGPIQFEKANIGWKNNTSCLSHNSSSSKLEHKEDKSKVSTSNTRETEKPAENPNKYFAILKKITQGSGRHYSHIYPVSSK